MGDLERDLKRTLRDANCKFVRAGRGDHEIWWSPVSNRNFVVDFGITSRHMANVVLKQAGLPKQF
jgi:hypothetical protein